jgi:hypothetical protein
MNVALQSKVDHFEPPRFSSVRVRLDGRCMLESRSEYPCVAIEMSPGGIRVQGPAMPQIGERIVVYLNELGRFAGVTDRREADGFFMTMQLSPPKRDRLADQLTWFANRHLFNLPEDRRHERIVPLARRALLRLPDGRDHIVKILDISLSGVGVETNVRPPVGTSIMIGETSAVVMRHFKGGFAGQFVNAFPVGHLDESTRL